MDHREVGSNVVKWTELAEVRVQWRALLLAILSLWFFGVHGVSLRKKVLKMWELHENEEVMFHCGNFSR
jgi:hypothetical protein